MSVMDKNHSRLVQAWKSYTEATVKYGVGSPEAKSLFWAFDEMVDLVRDKPFDAFEVILEILRITDEERILANLAAGPLEELLVEHGPEMIERILALAKSDSDPKFRDLLQGVWGNSIEKVVWKQIERLYESI